MSDPTGSLDAVEGVFETDATVSTPTVVFLTRAGSVPKGEHSSLIMSMG